jgi:hypothetical protein
MRNAVSKPSAVANLDFRLPELEVEAAIEDDGTAPRVISSGEGILDMEGLAVGILPFHPKPPIEPVPMLGRLT